MITKYKNNFPEVEAFLWDGDIEKAKEFFDDKWGNVAQAKEDSTILKPRPLIIPLANSPMVDSHISAGYYIIRYIKPHCYVAMTAFEFVNTYTQI